MSLVARSFHAKQVFQLCRLLSTSQTKQCHWCPDYKPGPYPKTEKERIEAAKKYNLLPEEYEPYPDDGTGSGDYPKLPFESVDSKDPYEPWDNHALRRNFMDPVSREIMLLLPEAISTGRQRYTPFQASMIFLGMCSAFYAVFYFLSLFYINEPVLKKQYPQEGVTHYTFDFEKDEDDEEEEIEVDDGTGKMRKVKRIKRGKERRGNKGKKGKGADGEECECN